MGEVRRVRLPLRRAVVALPAALAAMTAGTAFAASPTPAPDPAPVSTTTTTTRVTTTPKPAVSPPAKTRITTHTTTSTTKKPLVTSSTKTKTVKAVRPVKKPVVKVKPKVTHKPKAIPPKHHVTTKPVIGATPDVPTSAVVGANDTTRSGSNRGQLLLIVGALGLLALSLVPTRIVVLLGRLEPARAATVRVSLAVAGLSVGIGYLLALMLNKTS